jgi:hypothetical protein
VSSDNVDDFGIPIQRCAERMSNTERSMIRLESQFVGLETMIRFQLDKIREEKDQLKEHITRLIDKLDVLAEADIQVGKALAKNEAQWALMRWIFAGSLAIIIPVAGFLLPVTVKYMVNYNNQQIEKP